MKRDHAFLLLTLAMAVMLGYGALIGSRAESPIETTVTVDHVGTAPTGIVRPGEFHFDAPGVVGDSVIGAQAKQWEVIPMNGRGQPLGDARITARLGTRVLTGIGRTSWSLVPAGTWDLTVKAESQPDWTGRIILESGEHPQRTGVRMGQAFYISGILVDTSGAPVAQTPVYLLPEGVSHPSGWRQGDRDSKSVVPDSSLGGAVAARTTTRGGFELLVPESGVYRFSVGAGGRSRWTQHQGEELRNGGPGFAHVTVPELAHLTLQFSGSKADRPVEVEVYTYDPELALRVAALERERMQREQLEEQKRFDAQQKARQKNLEQQLKAGSKGSSATGKAGPDLASQGVAPPRARPQQSQRSTRGDIKGDGASVRDPLFEPGWGPIHSVAVKGETVVLRDLPDGQELRFLFLREGERHATTARTRLPRSVRSLGVVGLPPASAAKYAPVTTFATLSIERAPEAEQPEQVTGVVWKSVSR